MPRNDNVHAHTVQTLTVTSELTFNGSQWHTLRVDGKLVVSTDQVNDIIRNVSELLKYDATIVRDSEG